MGGNRQCFFLIGGTGNQLFQLARATKDDRISGLFLTGPLRRVLGHTDHETILPNLLGVSLATPFLNFVLLFLDLFLARVLGRSLFTDFDIRRFKMDASVKSLNALGYFQDRIDLDAHWLRAVGDALQDSAEHAPQLAVHFRGGDFLSPANASFGILDRSYYSEAIGLAIQSEPTRSITVFTNDDESARRFFSDVVFSEYEFTFVMEPLEATLRSLVASSVFVASNSTLSYCVTAFRGNDRPSIRPTPYNLVDSLPPLDFGVGVPARFVAPAELDSLL
ncbi:MAG: hypothetical protein AAFN07_02050 [Pseudomonadota bacterium]